MRAEGSRWRSVPFLKSTVMEMAAEAAGPRFPLTDNMHKITGFVLRQCADIRQAGWSEGHYRWTFKPDRTPLAVLLAAPLAALANSTDPEARRRADAITEALKLADAAVGAAAAVVRGHAPPDPAVARQLPSGMLVFAAANVVAAAVARRDGPLMIRCRQELDDVGVATALRSHQHRRARNHAKAFGAKGLLEAVACDPDPLLAAAAEYSAVLGSVPEEAKKIAVC